MTRLLLILGAFAALAATARAHHGAAAYDVARTIAVSGTIREWRWTNPHTAIVLDARTPAGALETWAGEGPPLTWARQRGWTSTTLRAGEQVTLVMYPSRREPRAGLVARVQRAAGAELVVQRPWLEAR